MSGETFLTLRKWVRRGTVASLIFFVPTAVLAIRSHWIEDQFAFSYQSGRVVGIGSEDETLTIRIVHHWPDGLPRPPAFRSGRRGAIVADLGMNSGEWKGEPKVSDWKALGLKVRVARGSISYVPQPASHGTHGAVQRTVPVVVTRVEYPYLSMAMIFGALPLTVGWFWVRRRYSAATRRWRRSRGLCPICAYDLTGNVSGTCPECGTRTDHN
jgi:hypothetical protein